MVGFLNYRILLPPIKSQIVWQDLLHVQKTSGFALDLVKSLGLNPMSAFVRISMDV